jgi:hypothetical protein
LEPVGHVADLLSDLEGPEELGPEFAASLDIERRNWTVQEAELCPLTNHEVELPVLAVVERLVLLMCLFEPLPYLCQELVAVLELCVHRR